MSLEQRIEQLELAFQHSLSEGTKIKLSEARTTMEMKAKNDVLTSMVAEVCIHLGISKERFLQHLQGRYAQALDRRLKGAQAVDDGISAALDTRGLHEVPTEEGYPPLFPEDQK